MANGDRGSDAGVAQWTNDDGGLPIIDPAGEADQIFSKIAPTAMRRRISTVA
jgi:hypothetical protein